MAYVDSEVGRLRTVLLHRPGAELARLTPVVAGVTRGELDAGSGLVARLLAPADFVVPPLPNLLFTRDSSV